MEFRSRLWTAILTFTLLTQVVSATILPPTRVSYAVQAASDAALAAIRQQDRYTRNAKGTMTRLTAEEHLRRANIYHQNRAFSEAREHC
jgi:hypothetical protein